jgi:hypothetical protein
MLMLKNSGNKVKKMISAYDPCPCKSGKKYKFCCDKIVKEKTLRGLVEFINKWPVYKCWKTYEACKSHKVSVFVVRTIPNGNYILGCYLLDLLCLGVKDTFSAIDISLSDISRYDVADARITKEIISYQDARSLILGSLAFAKKHGYAPHDDWEDSKCIIEFNSPYERKFTFGSNEESLYIPSIHDVGFEQTNNGKKVIIKYT